MLPGTFLEGGLECTVLNPFYPGGDDSERVIDPVKKE
jgi:hypothetical protein